MRDYHIDMKVRFTPDDQSLDALNKTVDEFKSAFKMSDEDVEKLRKGMSDFAERKASISEMGKMLESYRTSMGSSKYNDAYTKDLIKAMKELAGSNDELVEMYTNITGKSGGVFSKQGMSTFIGLVKTQIINQLGHLASSFISSITNVFKEAWKELGNMVNQSFLTNDTYRNNAFSYGMSASQSYGFEQAKSMLGISSEEQLYYMNDYQQEKFREIMTKYAERYEKLYDSGFFEDYLDFQIEMKEFKQDMQMEIIEFFMDNKDTIKEFMKIGISAMEFIVDALGWIMDAINPNSTSDEEKLDNINSILDQYVSNNNVTNNTVTMDGTYNFNGTTDSQKTAYTDMLKSSMVEAKKAFE